MYYEDSFACYLQCDEFIPAGFDEVGEYVFMDEIYPEDVYPRDCDVV